MYNKVILPTDGSTLSMKGVEEGLKAAKVFGIPAVTVFVINPSSYSQGILGQEIEGVSFSSQKMLREGFFKHGERILEKVKENADSLGVELETEISEGKPFDKITEIAGEDDIIYISSHGRSGLSSLFIGSTTDRVIKHSKCTVAIVRP